MRGHASYQHWTCAAVSVWAFVFGRCCSVMSGTLSPPCELWRERRNTQGRAHTHMHAPTHTHSPYLIFFFLNDRLGFCNLIVHTFAVLFSKIQCSHILISSLLPLCSLQSHWFSYDITLWGLCKNIKVIHSYQTYGTPQKAFVYLEFPHTLTHYYVKCQCIFGLF